MKYSFIAFIITLSVLGLILPNQGTAETKKTRVGEKHTDFYDAFLVLLDPYAKETINKKYPNRSYGLWNAEILEVTRVSGGFSQFDFIVKVEYDTYTGPHNPPEGPVTITFDVKTEGVTVTEIKG
ncbi:DUF3888 domain-containing protein [Bacillus sp. DX1.1]|uniref:DUF3888 domain-containing protein n=1 Tax=unclassified Bacillus (in: firmicutes) TaxID=185979 RepID=UPI00256FD6D6|nr:MULTISPECIES: DUF3888 domain-containing protein [unclassified Bacillus (in: firmicutes)]MDM5155610.1 DUF3888 domain-containing protein [Bacillus sp. DX1.1]WJE79917.1 DUF3888 domain-containing protein [Bacillus sp. DX3.1]